VELSKKGLWRGVIREFREFLPEVKEEYITTLLEGDTPLIESFNMKDIFGEIRLLFKFEGLNPTCSFKDRGMTMAVTMARQDGTEAIICASTGNTSASAAAYAARAGMKAFVLIPKGGVALGKVSQAIMHGAVVIEVDATFDSLLSIVKEVNLKYPVAIVNSVNPYRIEGQKTGAYEIAEHLGHAPTYHFLPVGNAGNITAYWKGYKEYESRGFIANLPKMMGFQAAGAAPIVLGHPVADPQTLATAIKIGNPASWGPAEKARDESGGVIDAVSDDEIVSAYRLVAAREGVFCEPASAASIAGAIKMKDAGVISDGDTVVCTLTGHGLKDPDRAIAVSTAPIKAGSEFKDIVDIMGF